MVARCRGALFSIEHASSGWSTCGAGIDNNPAERALRPIGIGRKNWLFAGADTGAETLARAMTVIETAKLNGLDLLAYLADILDRIHDHKINRLAELLPWNWTPQASVANS